MSSHGRKRNKKKKEKTKKRWDRRKTSLHPIQINGVTLIQHIDGTGNAVATEVRAKYPGGDHILFDDQETLLGAMENIYSKMGTSEEEIQSCLRRQRTSRYVCAICGCLFVKKMVLFMPCDPIPFGGIDYIFTAFGLCSEHNSVHFIDMKMHTEFRNGVMCTLENAQEEYGFDIDSIVPFDDHVEGLEGSLSSMITLPEDMYDSLILEGKTHVPDDISMFCPHRESEDTVEAVPIRAEVCGPCPHSQDGNSKAGEVVCELLNMTIEPHKVLWRSDGCPLYLEHFRASKADSDML